MAVFSPAAADIVAWALVDSLWQAALIAATLRAARGSLQRTARLRHVTALAGLVGTAALCGTAMLAPHAAHVAPFPLSTWVAQGWLIGTVILLLRLAGGLWVLHHRELAITDQWSDHVARLRERLGIARPVAIAAATAQCVGVFGHRRPVIVVPAEELSALSPHEVEVVLAHELAHVRRHDYAINLVQAALDTMLFYNPAARLLSRWARTSREQLCDEQTVAVCGGAIEYANVLLTLGKRRRRPGQAPSIASDGQLLARVRHLTSEAPATVSRHSRSAVVVTGAVLASALWALRAVREAATIAAAGSFSLAHTAQGFAPFPTETAPALLVAGGLGLLLGVRHAFEPDHLIAVSTLVAGEGTPSRAARLGVSWGIGHAAALLLVGTALALLQRSLSPYVTDAFEFGVALMLTLLGIRALTLSVRGGSDGPVRTHSHGLVTHRHGGGSGHVHFGSWALAPRPLLVGAVHGLAGSGALTALVMATLPSTLARLAYIAVFALGSTFGMAVLSASAGWPLSRLVRQPASAAALYAVSGVLAVAYGAMAGSPLVYSWWFR